MPKQHTTKMYMGHGGKAPPHITKSLMLDGEGGHKFRSSAKTALSYPMFHSLSRHSTVWNFYCHQESNPSSSGCQCNQCLRYATFYMVKVSDENKGLTVNFHKKLWKLSAEVKFFLWKAMKAHMGSRCTALLFL